MDKRIKRTISTQKTTVNLNTLFSLINTTTTNRQALFSRFKSWQLMPLSVLRLQAFPVVMPLMHSQQRQHCETLRVYKQFQSKKPGSKCHFLLMAFHQHQLLQMQRRCLCNCLMQQLSRSIIFALLSNTLFPQSMTTG